MSVHLLPKRRTAEAVERRRKMGRVVRELRELAEVSVTQAASEAGVSYSTWLRWESGHTAIPLELVADIARAIRRDPVRSLRPYLVAA